VKSEERKIRDGNKGRGEPAMGATEVKKGNFVEKCHGRRRERPIQN